MFKSRANPRVIVDMPATIVIVNEGRRNSLSLDAIEWVEIWKHDELTTDLICITIAGGGTRLLLHEEMEGFDAALSLIETMPGFDRAWRTSVLMPPFRENRTTVYQRSVAPPGE